MLHVRGLREEEFPGVLYPLLEACFTSSKESRIFYQLHRERPYDTPRWDYSRAGFIDGHLVSHVGIWRFDLQLRGDITLAAGGIRDVATHPGFQKRGFGHAVLTDAVSFMESEGLDVSLLYAGPTRFYEAKGWWRGVPTHVFDLDLRTCELNEGLVPSIRVERITRVNDDMVRKLFIIRDATSKNLEFTVKRSLDYFKRVLESYLPGAVTKGNAGYIVRNASSGEIIGYVLGRESISGERIELQVFEARFSSEDVDVTIRTVLSILKNDGGIDLARIKLSRNHELARVALDLGAKDSSGLVSGLMVKIISRAGFMDKLVAAVNLRSRGRPRPPIPDGETLVITIQGDHLEPATSETFKITFHHGEPDWHVTIEKGDDHTPPGGFVHSIVVPESVIMPVLFSPVMDVADAMDEGMITGNNPCVPLVNLLFSKFSWDKEITDYF